MQLIGIEVVVKYGLKATNVIRMSQTPRHNSSSAYIAP